MGTGKSRTTIDILRARINQERRLLRTIIFCPPIVIRNWAVEWGKYSKVPVQKVIPLLGSGKKRLQTFCQGVENSPAIFITNYESLLLLNGDLLAAFKAWQPEALVFDESHYLKDGTSKRSKLAEELANPWDKRAKRALPKPYTYILSGTPVLNSAMDLFHQYLVMDGGATFGNNFFAFRARFFRDRNAGMPKGRYFPKWEIMTEARDGFDALGFITEAMKPTSMRVEKKDCLDLPPLVREVRTVEMSKEQARLYVEMKQDLITFIEKTDGERTASTAMLAMTKALRLQQIASGYVKTVEGEEIELEDTPKMEALAELLSDLTPNHKVLVWAVWRKNYEQIKRVCIKLGLKYVEVYGEISDSKKAANVTAFNEDPSVRVFIGHPGSGGIGINLTLASYSIFYSRTFKLAESLQAEARNHRGGSKEAGHLKITRIDLVCAGTIDEIIAEKLAQKVELSDTLLRDLALELKNAP